MMTEINNATGTTANAYSAVLSNALWNTGSWQLLFGSCPNQCIVILIVTLLETHPERTK